MALGQNKEGKEIKCIGVDYSEIYLHRGGHWQLFSMIFGD